MNNSNCEGQVADIVASRQSTFVKRLHRERMKLSDCWMCGDSRDDMPAQTADFLVVKPFSQVMRTFIHVTISPSCRLLYFSLRLQLWHP